MPPEERSQEEGTILTWLRASNRPSGVGLRASAVTTSPAFSSACRVVLPMATHCGRDEEGIVRK